MENASKAIIIAGSIFITIIIVSVLIMVFKGIGYAYSEQQQSLSEEQIQKYNKQFDTYDRSLYGSELLSLANLIDDYNYRVLYEENQKGKFYEENKIEVTVRLERPTIGYTSADSSFSYKGLLANKDYDIKDIKAYNDGLTKRLETMEKNNVSKDSDDYQNVKSSLTELRSMPFICTRKEYNKYGRIQEMDFKQKWDSHIENVIDNN